MTALAPENTERAARAASRAHLDPFRPQASFVEAERSASGEIVSVATIFLTNRECPWRCVYCDLWKNTTIETVPVGAVPAQIDFALAELRKERCRQIKLYNAGSFFDPNAVPPQDFPAIANRMRGFERVIVECHPALVGESAVHFRDLLSPQPHRSVFDADTGMEESRDALRIPSPLNGEKVAEGRMRGGNTKDSDSRKNSNPVASVTTPHPTLSPLRGEGPLTTRSAPVHSHKTRCALSPVGAQLEIAMGLEVADDALLARLNKRMTLAMFQRAAESLVSRGIHVRAFVIVKPPFVRADSEAVNLARRSIDFAFDCGATAVSLIPGRFGPDALRDLAKAGEFAPPSFDTLEASLDYGIAQGRGRVFADLWDIESLGGCCHCMPERVARLREINLRQTVLPRITCSHAEAKCVPAG